MRAQFPGFFPPATEERSAIYRGGLIVPDTNILLDLYRFRRDARDELLAALNKFGDRIFVPHRVSEEFLSTRISVIRARATDTRELLNSLESAKGEVARVLTRAQDIAAIPQANVTELQTAVNKCIGEVKQTLRDLLDEKNAVSPRTDDSDDEVLRRVEETLAGKIGPPLTAEEFRIACIDAGNRFDHKIPPGFEDADKSFHKAVGDYILWVQVLQEATRRNLPVLIVSGDVKPDWVRRDGAGRPVGPHPGLVDELKRVAGTQLIWADATLFLEEAAKYVQAAVSPQTLDEARNASRHEPDSRLDGSDTVRDPFARSKAILEGQEEVLMSDLREIETELAETWSASDKLRLESRRDRTMHRLKQVRDMVGEGSTRNT
jgi:predicted nucleic acid-binding protein